MEQPILYIAPVLPKRSETFVYREIFGLRQLGIPIVPASLYEPEQNLGSRQLEQLAQEVIRIYSSGWLPLLRDALRFELYCPLRAWRTYGLCLRDILFASDLKLPSRPKLYFQCLAALALAWRVRKLRPRHIHAHFAHSSATIAMDAAYALGIPFSFTGHAADLFRERALLIEKLRRAKFVVSISHWHQFFYQSLHNRPLQDYPVVRCGVDVAENFSPPQQTSSVFRILSIGRLVPKKGFDVLLRAAKIFQEKIKDFSIKIAGGGPELQTLQELAKGLPVEFLGEINHYEVPSLCHGADVFVLPCKVAADGDRDGIPVALMEAMAAGVCVVSGDLPTIRELIENRVSGILVPPGNEKALAEAIFELASQPTLRQSLAKKGWQKVREEFSSTANLAKLQKLYTNP